MSIESPSQPVLSPAIRSKNGLGTAALVLGVASLVAALSFVLLPLGLLGGFAVLDRLPALTRGRAGERRTRAGRSRGGVRHSTLAVGIAFSVRAGTSWRITRAFSPASATASPRQVTAAN
jgi:hypothetical protein